MFDTFFCIKRAEARLYIINMQSGDVNRSEIFFVSCDDKKMRRALLSNRKEIRRLPRKVSVFEMPQKAQNTPDLSS